MECPKCGYAMGPFDVDCPRCKRMGPPSEPPKPAAPTQCPTCSLPLLPEKPFCPRCITVVPPGDGASALPPSMFRMEIGALRPLEAFLWDRRGQKLTDAQLQKQIERAGLSRPTEGHQVAHNLAGC